jgi:hypothetical protein
VASLTPQLTAKKGKKYLGWEAEAILKTIKALGGAAKRAKTTSPAPSQPKKYIKAMNKGGKRTGMVFLTEKFFVK